MGIFTSKFYIGFASINIESLQAMQWNNHFGSRGRQFQSILIVKSNKPSFWLKRLAIQLEYLKCRGGVSHKVDNQNDTKILWMKELSKWCLQSIQTTHFISKVSGSCLNCHFKMDIYIWVVCGYVWIWE